ncbi:MAG: hypothetical protein ACK2UW_05590 [Anaerolineales bacterium]
MFAAVLRPDGNYQWMYSSSGTPDWINLTYASVPPVDLRFGDFNSDVFTDVFAALPIGGGLLQWVYSSKGTGAFQNLVYADTPLADLRFGDFNANGQTDIFTVQDVGGGHFDWLISYDSTSNYHNVNTANTPLDQMLFVDVNGDAHTDVFTTVPDQATPDLFDWLYSSHGYMEYQTIMVNGRSYAEIRPGDFDGDYKSDFFFTTPLNGGLYQWWYQSPVKIGATKLNYASTLPDQLRFGDFNGDNITDVFALVQQCKVNLPALFNGQ